MARLGHNFPCPMCNELMVYTTLFHLAQYMPPQNRFPGLWQCNWCKRNFDVAAWHCPKDHDFCVDCVSQRAALAVVGAAVPSEGVQPPAVPPVAEPAPERIRREPAYDSYPQPHRDVHAAAAASFRTPTTSGASCRRCSRFLALSGPLPPERAGLCAECAGSGTCQRQPVCHYDAPIGRPYCTYHSCPVPRCAESKSHNADACPHHSLATGPPLGVVGTYAGQRVYHDSPDVRPSGWVSSNQYNAAATEANVTARNKSALVPQPRVDYSKVPALPPPPLGVVLPGPGLGTAAPANTVTPGIVPPGPGLGTAAPANTVTPAKANDIDVASTSRSSAREAYMDLNIRAVSSTDSALTHHSLQTPSSAKTATPASSLKTPQSFSRAVAANEAVLPPTLEKSSSTTISTHGPHQKSHSRITATPFLAPLTLQPLRITKESLPQESPLEWLERWGVPNLKQSVPLIETVLHDVKDWIDTNRTTLMRLAAERNMSFPRQCIEAFAMYTHDLQLLARDPTENLYACLNAMLRKRQRGALAAWNPFISWFVFALSETVIYSGTVYRGIFLSKEEIESQYAPFTEVQWSGFTSCTTSKEVSADYASEVGCILRIRVHYAHHLGKFSMFPDDDEVLIPPNAKLLVLERTEEQFPSLPIIDLAQMGKQAVTS